jgi:hypothetical protein
VEGVALEHLPHRTKLAGASTETADGRSQPVGIEVEAHDPGAAFEGAVAVTPLAAARVEEALTGAKLKPLEIDREQH